MNYRNLTIDEMFQDIEVKPVESVTSLPDKTLITTGDLLIGLLLIAGTVYIIYKIEEKKHEVFTKKEENN
jgi:hypothetical protein